MVLHPIGKSEGNVKPSPAQCMVLLNLSRGLPPDEHVHGHSAYGGYSATVSSLLRRKWVRAEKHNSLELTEAGKAVLSAHAQKL